MLQWLRRIGHEVDFSPEHKFEVTTAPEPARFLPLAQYHGVDCPYCGTVMMIGTRRQPTRDHKIPRCRRSEFIIRPEKNIEIVCGPCNNDKGARTLAEFAMSLHLRGDPRAMRVAAYIRREGWTERSRTVGRAAEGAGPENQ